jgi:hypothetical protein
MARPTQKQIKEQNQALLNDARNRLQNAARQVSKLETDLVAARAVEQSARDAYDQLEKRLNPQK